MCKKWEIIGIKKNLLWGIMKKELVLSLTALSLIMISCQTKTGTGALAGGAIGAGTGAIIGGGTGAAIGAAAGALGGGLIGAALDEQDRRIMEQQSPNTLKRIDRGESLSIRDVKAMSKAGINDDTIMDLIDNTNSVFYLSADDIIDLKKSGVSQRVINYMVNTSS